ncbi:hypothetical protein SLA2020_397780 [Shorea laevis]
MEEDPPASSESLDRSIVPNLEPEEHHGFGPWMLVERKKNRKKPNGKLDGLSNQQSKANTAQGVNSEYELTGSRNRLKHSDGKASHSKDNAFNVSTVNCNGSVEFNGSEAQLQGHGPIATTNQVSSNKTLLAKSDPNLFTVQDPSCFSQDKTVGKDKVAVWPKETRSRKEGLAPVDPNPNTRDVKGLQAAPSTAHGSQSNGSKILRETVQGMGHISGQRRKQTVSNGGGSEIAIGKGSKPNRGLGSGHSHQKLEQTSGSAKGGRSYPISAASNRMDPSSASSAGTGHVSHIESDMELDGREAGVGVLGGPNFSSDSKNPEIQFVSQQNVVNGEHEGCAPDHSERGGSMQYESSLHSDCAPILLPGSEHDDQEQTERHSSMEPRAGSLGHEFLQ